MPLSRVGRYHMSLSREILAKYHMPLSRVGRYHMPLNRVARNHVTPKLNASVPHASDEESINTLRMPLRMNDIVSVEVAKVVEGLDPDWTGHPDLLC